MSTYLAAKVQEVFIEPALDLLCPSLVRGGLWQPVKGCLGLTGLRRHQSAQSHKREDFPKMPYLAGQLHRPVVLAPSSSVAGAQSTALGCSAELQGTDQYTIHCPAWKCGMHSCSSSDRADAQ